MKDLKRNDDDFNVFVHGDLWVNNLMFRYSDDTNEVVDVR
jgi:thiamine kinase-like enzyme